MINLNHFHIVEEFAGYKLYQHNYYGDTARNLIVNPAGEIEAITWLPLTEYLAQNTTYTCQYSVVYLSNGGIIYQSHDKYGDSFNTL